MDDLMREYEDQVQLVYLNENEDESEVGDIPFTDTEPPNDDTENKPTKFVDADFLDLSKYDKTELKEVERFLGNDTEQCCDNECNQLIFPRNLLLQHRRNFKELEKKIKI